jgi:hypothetical protein
VIRRISAQAFQACEILEGRTTMTGTRVAGSRLVGRRMTGTKATGSRVTGTRVAAVIVTVLCILLNIAAPLDGHASQRSIPSKPLVLIGEPSRDDGASLWSRAGLVSRLEDSGYELGKTLFVYTPREPYGDLDSGAYTLRQMLDETIEATGCSMLDVAAYGVSGLVLRFGLEMGIIRDGLVDNAIMLSTPQRGSFLADLLLQACTVVKHECLFERETRYSRFSPFGDVSPTLDPGTISSRSTGDLPASIGSSYFSWEGEAWWVAQRAREIYEPLYSQYVQERFLSLPYVPVDSPKQTFAGWIKQNRPHIWENCIAAGIRPPFGPLPGDALDGPPQAGYDFTVAYYELLAMAVGRNQYVVRMASSGSLGQALFGPSHGPMPGSLKDAIIQYGLKALLHYAKKALVTVKAEVQRMIADSIVSSIGYLDSAESQFLRRLVKEEVLVNLGTSAGQRFYRVPANYYLDQINRRSSSSSYTRNTRFVSITGRVTNLLGIVWPQVAPNNLFCEVDSAVPPQGPRDTIRVFNGFLSPSYLNLLKDKQVQDSIVSLLLEPDELAQVTTGHSGQQQIRVSSWQPSYVSPPWGTAGDQVFQVSVSIPSLPEGWGCAVWVEGYDGGRWLPVPGWNQLLTSGTKTDVILKHTAYRIGLRLVRTGTVNPYTPGGKVESAFEREVSGKALLSVDPLSTAEGAPWGNSPGEDMWGGSTPSEGVWGPGAGYMGDDNGPATVPAAPGSGTDPAGTGSWDDSPGENGPPGSAQSPAAGDGIPGDIPSVRVVYRNKHTTLWKPHETYHVYWEVDFGDGETVVLQGQPRLKIAHTFNPSGQYLVRAVSYDNHNDVLVEKSWNVVTGGEPEVREFCCSSIIPPEVELELIGPQKWVTGKHALFSGEVTWKLPDGAHIVSVDCDPGERFHVLWERSGEFTVYWAARLTIDYELEDRVIRVKNTYVTEKQVDVFTPGITR